MDTAELEFGPVSMDFLDRVEELESQGFPEDEAASRDTMAYRLQNASTFFVGTFLCQIVSPGPHGFLAGFPEIRKTLIGYVVGTCSNTERLEHENMFSHDPSGSHLCVHSVLVHPDYQNRGVAKRSLLNYVQHIKKSAPQITRISLIAKESKTRLYEGCGFTLIGKSHVVHGQDTWFELTMQLS
jgi:GNAT superfamily N-acetyltransferase